MPNGDARNAERDDQSVTNHSLHGPSVDKEPSSLKLLIHKGELPQQARKRKRKVLIDEQKTISSEQMRKQLQDTSDIIRSWCMAPRTVKLMLLQENNMFDKMWIMPGYMGDDIEAPPYSQKLLAVWDFFMLVYGGLID